MFYVNDEPEGKFLYTEPIKLYCRGKNLFTTHLLQTMMKTVEVELKLLHICYRP